MSAYPNAKFLTSADAKLQFPPDSGSEVAIAGRSNAGKSSALNAIVGRKALARTSRTPGATRLINFFELAPGRRLVDLPGYGFAAVSGEMRRHWGALIESYFASRTSLRGVIVVMDVRHPMTPHDRSMLELAGGHGLPVHLLLTKADKLGRGAAQSALRAASRDLDDGVTAQVFSARSGEGLAGARGRLEALLSTPQKRNPG
jgi:GTP-binding protein